MMDAKDRLILEYLRKNARHSLVKISRETQIPVSTIYERLKKGETTFIKKFTVIPDFPKMGYSIRAFFLVKKLEGLCQKNINSVFKLNHDYSFLLDCVFKNMSEVKKFTDSIEERYELIYVTQELKREEFLGGEK